ncbi:hypothetical protein BY458DRAFT_496730 [Sporodiniella umbellata]|nr:hypothetical protein BY458DRAFT_496730 [Sporodiniella umbellata]
MKPLDAVQEIFTLKTGNIQLKQEPFQPENHESVAHSIIRFRRWRAAFESQRIITVQDVPNKFYDLFALLAHESNESLETLATRINTLLTPFIQHKEGIESFKNVIKEIIKVIAHQEEYGLGSVVLLIEKAPFTIPEVIHQVCFWC